MLDIKTIALCLLIARLISVTFIVMVLVRQYRLFGLPIDFSLVPGISKLEKRSVYRLRRVLFTLSVVIFLGNMIPILIDSLTLFVETSRPSNLHTISIMYAFSNSLTAMFSAIMIWLLYRVAGIGVNTNRK